MQEAVEMAGIFIDDGLVAQYKNRDAKIVTLKDINRGSMWDGPLILLVNGYSASASEMLAGTLQDYNRAVIVGSATYGKATAQVVLPLDTTITLDTDIDQAKASSYIKITISELYRVNGKTAQGKGVQPDIELPDILDVSPQREANEEHVLICSPIESNKYFKPGVPIAMDNLKALAKSEVDASLFFTELKSYIADTKADNVSRDISLKLSDAIGEAMKETNASLDTTLLTKEKPPYSVENNLYEKQQILVDDQLKEIDKQWENFLKRDPYLKVAYDVIVLMK
jgi:carboxyl-terminal processing protease